MRAAAVLVALVCAGLGGCASMRSRPLHDEAPRGTWYVASKGDTVASIARAQKIPVEDLREANGLGPRDVIAEGQILFILGPDVFEEPTPRDTPAAPTFTGRSGFAWPLARPVISSGYGMRWGRLHEGLDLAAPTGTPVLAAADGEVIYAGDKIRGYGNMVVLRHDRGVLTVYAHNSVVLVRRGDRTRRGQMIARVGQSGRATAPHLHFEVRESEVPRDPLAYLPAN
jgi:murein DD-endopeptidase MepM/ murein hydrolase activator NlpD